jgi:hypothetical protein
VTLPEWHPDPDSAGEDITGGNICWCGVARKAA